jgi:hypothetical protein
MWGATDMKALNEIKQTAVGAAVLADWLGDGLHLVAQEKADRRALSCLTGNDGAGCPHLSHPGWWDSAKGSVASAIKKQLEAKAGLKLETDLDRNVPRMCSVCGCCAPLKAWAPIKHIAAHTPEDLVKKFPPHCWIRQEIENL